MIQNKLVVLQLLSEIYQFHKCHDFIVFYTYIIIAYFTFVDILYVFFARYNAPFLFLKNTFSATHFILKLISIKNKQAVYIKFDFFIFTLAGYSSYSL